VLLPVVSWNVIHFIRRIGLLSFWLQFVLLTNISIKTDALPPAGPRAITFGLLVPLFSESPLYFLQPSTARLQRYFSTTHTPASPKRNSHPSEPRLALV
jgi:hypothetical protein